MKKIIKKWWKAYCKAMAETYSSAWQNGVIPYHF